MGGRTEFFGPVVREPDEPVFHEPWEGRVFGMSWFLLAMFGRNVDRFRYVLERLPRDVYLSGYYQRWLAGIEKQLIEAGYVGPDEVDARLTGRVPKDGTRRVSRARAKATALVLRLLLRPKLPRPVASALPRVMGNSRPALRRPRYAVGDRVRVRSERAAGHTRQPGYVTGKPGVIVSHQGSSVFPDAHAVGRRARPQHLYTVSFAGGDLWGEAAEPGTEILVDLYESYLEPA